MYSIELPDQNVLDFPPDVQFSFELQNSVFTRSDTTVLPGSFTFPVKLPATGRNLALFNHPQLVTSANARSYIAGVWVRAHGIRMFYGDLRLRRAGSSIEVSVVSNPLKSTKDISLQELSLGGTRTFGASTADRRTLMQATADTPEDYDFVFCPVSAPFFFSEAPSGLAGTETSWQNRYSKASSEFALLDGPTTPFVKIKYVLEQLIAEISGWGFTNDWQITNELRRLYFYNNIDIHVVDGTTRELPDDFSLADHVPDLTGAELLKQLAELFCLGVFTNSFSRSIALRPLDTVLSASYRHDWTNYVDGGSTVDYEDTDPFLQFRHQPVDYTNSRSVRKEYHGTVEALTHYTTEADIDTAISGGLAEGFYYVNATELIYYVDSLANKSIVRHARERKFFEATPALEPKLQPLITGDVIVSAGVNHYLCQYRQQGSYFKTGALASDTEYLENNPDPAIFFYRGMQDNYPHASVGLLDPDGTGTAQVTTTAVSEGAATTSLLWPGTAGLYAKQWQRWHEVTRSGKPVSYRLLLPIHELTSFEFHHKIRIINMDYFVRELKVNRLASDGKFVVDASLFTVI